jgi:hypothetical protein
VQQEPAALAATPPADLGDLEQLFGDDLALEEFSSDLAPQPHELEDFFSDALDGVDNESKPALSLDGIRYRSAAHMTLVAQKRWGKKLPKAVNSELGGRVKGVFSWVSENLVLGDFVVKCRHNSEWVCIISFVFVCLAR